VKKAALAFLPDKRRKRARQMALSLEKYEAQLLGMLDRIEKRWAEIEPLQWPDGPQWLPPSYPQTGVFPNIDTVSLQYAADDAAARQIVELDLKIPSPWVEVDLLPPRT